MFTTWKRANKNTYFTEQLPEAASGYFVYFLRIEESRYVLSKKKIKFYKETLKKTQFSCTEPRTSS